MSVSEDADGAGKVQSRNPATKADEKSDTPIIPRKPSNKGVHPAETVEGTPTDRTGPSHCVSRGAEFGDVRIPPVHCFGTEFPK